MSPPLSPTLIRVALADSISEVTGLMQEVESMPIVVRAHSHVERATRGLRDAWVYTRERQGVACRCLGRRDYEGAREVCDQSYEGVKRARRWRAVAVAVRGRVEV